ncbi:hypothetical protein [Longibaculum muris]|nr:hypothetical protein [Longibaculum muris]KXU52092.1 hypothetical protein HMPREF3037_00432 [Candidatus Stoquefichus sp. KLE1796]MCR1888787.1 hypothetical protein [Longibaculum muris]MED9810980.1 hypothetical protein [Longibaculum muris]
MKEDCYVKDTAQAISDFVVVEKKEDLKKKEFPLKAAVCKSCGYVELYVDVNEE